MDEKFNQRKNSVLTKLDKSSKGSWDEKIVSLCEMINSLDEFYTTSSCAGRIVLIVNQDKKEENLFLKVWHGKISFEELKSGLEEISKNKNVKFKMESCILHVACEDLESAQKLLDKARAIGWRRSGIISSEDKFILELNSTEKLEFPLIQNGKVLVDDDFLKIVISESNKKLERSWKKINELSKIL